MVTLLLLGKKDVRREWSGGIEKSLAWSRRE